MAEDAARELPNLPLEDALQLVHLYAERGSPKYEKAALRWLERYLTESSPRLRRFAEVSADSSRSGWEALPTLRALFDCVAQVCPTRNTPSVPTRRVAMSTTTSAMGTFYDEQRAASQLRKYREKGPIPSTQGSDRGTQGRGDRRNDAARHRRRDRRDPARAPRCRRDARDLCRRLRSLPRRGAPGGREPRPRKTRHLHARRLRRPGRHDPSCRHRDR